MDESITTEKLFHDFVANRINIPVEEKAPVCPFEFGGECNTAYSEECYNCEHSKADFMALIERLRSRRKSKVKAQVFCVSCGAKQRTLRKWHNSYLCVDCYKIMQRVGEDKFIKALQGKE